MQEYIQEILEDEVDAFLGRKKSPRYHVRCTPTHASWPNQIKRWFGLITQQSIWRGSFKSVGELIRNIKKFVETYNKNARPFVWTATADSIFAKLTRLLAKISGTGH